MRGAWRAVPQKGLDQGRRPEAGLSQWTFRKCGRCWNSTRASNFIPQNACRFAKAIPHNSKYRYGERGAADAKPKAQIILDVLSSILATQLPCRSRRSGA
ncbi:MAG: hypothetical protein PUE42_05435 [Subdoligranulum sp.]|nr:hypothetical protein [Subdoligranulum sp.]